MHMKGPDSTLGRTCSTRIAVAVVTSRCKSIQGKLYLVTLTEAGWKPRCDLPYFFRGSIITAALAGFEFPDRNIPEQSTPVLSRA